ncbi:MAG TPA: hypothetical protein PKU94_08545 [Candidatus Hydrothermia bacterium]|nr:hypothetical protein [Candidatus Hydrothermia bacterium]
MASVTLYPNSATYERVEKVYDYYTETIYYYIDRVKKADGSYAYTSTIASKAGTQSKPGRIKVYGFNANIPAGSRIDSITVEWKNYIRNPYGRTTGTPNIPSVSVNLLGNTTLQSKKKTKTGPVPTSAATWSLTWTASETGLTQDQLLQVVNSSSFGAYLNPARNTNYNTGIYYVDYVKITVTYSVPTWTLVASDSAGSTQDKRNISVYLQDTAGVAKSGTYTVTIGLSDGLVIDSVTTCEGSLSGNVWNAQIQSDSRADLSFVVRTTVTGTNNYTVSFTCTPPGSSELSQSRSFSLTRAPQSINGLVPSYSYSEADEYSVLPSTGDYGTSFKVQNTDVSNTKAVKVYYDTTDYQSYTVSNGSFTTGNPGVWTINANSTSTLTLKYAPTSKRFIKLVEPSTSTVLFRRVVIPYDYYESGYGAVKYPVNDARNGEYEFKALIKAVGSIDYPKLKIQAPGVGYNVSVYDLSGNRIKSYPFGSYALYNNYQLVEFSFTTNNGVGYVEIEGMASYTDWTKTDYQLNVLTPTLRYAGGYSGTGGVLFLEEATNMYKLYLNPGEESQEYSIKTTGLEQLSTKNLYGLSISFDYSVQGDSAVLEIYTTDQTGELLAHRSIKLEGEDTISIGGPGDFIGFDEAAGPILENLGECTLTMKVMNETNEPVTVSISNIKVEALYSQEYDGEGFTFNGKHSQLFSTNIKELKVGFGGGRSLKLYGMQNTDDKIPSGWEGKTRNIEMKLITIADGLEEGQALARHISEWLSTGFWTSGEVDIGTLIFDFDENIEFKVVRSEEIDIDIKAPGFLEISVKFDVMEVYNRIGGVSGPSGTIRGVRTIRPVIELVATGGSIEIIEDFSNKSIKLLGSWTPGTRLYVDCKRRRVYDDDGKLLKNVVDISSDWIELYGAYNFKKSIGCNVVGIKYTEHY